MSKWEIIQRGLPITILLFNDILEGPWNQVTPRIHGNNLLLIAPLRKWPNVNSRLSICEIGSEVSEVSISLKVANPLNGTALYETNL